MRSGLAGIDHVVLGVRDLERARMGWTRLGFTLTPRGRHLGQGTANYCIMFARDYVELLGFVERDDATFAARNFFSPSVMKSVRSVPSLAHCRSRSAVRGCSSGSGCHDRSSMTYRPPGAR